MICLGLKQLWALTDRQFNCKAQKLNCVYKPYLQCRVYLMLYPWYARWYEIILSLVLVPKKGLLNTCVVYLIFQNTSNIW